MSTFYTFTMKTIDGTERTLGAYRGKVLLVVNVASKCGLTPQYAKLQSLYERLKDPGLEILGFPCNQFGSQEPGTEAEVKSFCSATYGVTFPLFAKIEVNGPARAPLYEWLASRPTRPDGPGDISWNFAKFVLDRGGEVTARFEPRTEPDAPVLLQAVERALAR
jgi:glutathione peroxidase